MSNIKDIALAPSGELKIDWVKRNCPLLRTLEGEFAAEKPFAGLRIALSVHLEAKTAYLCRVLAAGGAEMYITGSNPLSTQDDVAAALVQGGLEVFAAYGCTEAEYEANIRAVLAHDCNIIIDDGGDLVGMLHEELPEKLQYVLGGCEETTTGIIRLKAMAAKGALRFPMILVNDADCKHLFDNRYGTGQSVWDGINRTTNLIVAGKTVVVAGYGWCGKGVAMRAKGMGANVIVTEIDPFKALDATMNGYRVMPMDEAAKVGDLFITTTGCKDIITPRHFAVMKDQAILTNAGHFDCEVDVASLRKLAVKETVRRENIQGYTLADGRTLNVVGEGRLVNLAAGNGHPAEIMDMSFAVQALSLEWLVKHQQELETKLYKVPDSIDDEIGRVKLAAMGLAIDTLTPEQEAYLTGWQA